MESSVKTASLPTRNRQRKQSHRWPWNRHSSMSDSRCMDSTASTNSRATHKTDSKNRFMLDAWNRQTHYASAYPEIVSENWVTVGREIIFENWVKGDGWNRQRILIHGWRMKSIEKTESSLTHGIFSENCVTADQKSTANTNSRLTNEIIRENRVIVDAWNREWTLRHYRPEIISENRVTIDLEIATEIWVTTDLWSRQRPRIHERRIKPIAKIDSYLTHGIVKHTMI